MTGPWLRSADRRRFRRSESEGWPKEAGKDSEGSSALARSSDDLLAASSVDGGSDCFLERVEIVAPISNSRPWNAGVVWGVLDEDGDSGGDGVSERFWTVIDQKCGVEAEQALHLAHASGKDVVAVKFEGGGAGRVWRRRWTGRRRGR